MRIWVYILECADGAFYVGSYRGDDPAEREAEHNDGRDPKAWTYSRRPVKLVWCTEFEDPGQAVACERQLKGWTRLKKQAVIRGEWATLPALARRRSRANGETPKRKTPKQQ